MTSSERNKAGGAPAYRTSFQRSISPSGRFCSSTISSSSSTFTSSMSTFSSPARSTSPTRISVRGGYVTTSPSVRFSIDNRHTSPGRSVASPSSSRNSNNKVPWSHGSKKTCLCSPTTHPGSFRCSLHKNLNTRNVNNSHDNTVLYRSHRLYARRSAMTNSLVRIGTVEGDLVKRALAALIRPSSHQQKRRSDFQPRPSRLSVMSKADD
ncbi:hypothetical protein L1987_47988 [Smallanthus sonchifolius]|uniref:Uncharacterized protein n=1 Tax=Smallanthus sonchifolius TaxID=185202 RepID=A0ACB9FQD2_9ASTR|nr:hypothetical protein L1987_47988 [Smallanthus sonchifolius]